MIDSVDLLFILLVGLVLVVAIFITRRRVADHLAESQKTKLFKVRDDLVFLVGEGRLSEDDKLFQYFYRATNNALKHVDHINLRTFVTALTRMRQDGADPAEKRNLEGLKAALRDKDPEVREATNEYFRAIMDILVANSWQLPLLIRFGALVGIMKKFGDAVKVRIVQRDAYGFYLDYDRALQG